jgi:signal peptidase I
MDTATGKRREQGKTPGKAAAGESWDQKLRAFFRELGIVFGAFLVLNSFVLASFEVPTGSMENEIMTGDFLLVNKFVFGGTTPRTIPFTNVRLPAFKLPSLWDVDRGDIIVFMFPGYREEVQAREFAYYLKRAIAVAGDTLQIINRTVYINGVATMPPRNVKFNYATVKSPGWHDPKLFPPGSPGNEDNYGPVVVPREGDVIPLDGDTFTDWEIFIKREGHTAERRDGVVLIDGKPATTYTVQRDYLFGMGDNRDNSLDSRFWGFIPEEDVVGTPLIVYWSWDPNIPVTDFGSKVSSIRFGRVGTLVR